ncbi:BTB/POZ domain-containing protein [Rhizophagus diaphanus]|nr:BTB/POZ domain-containing protein [Rhizophagus diaphanus] [Rhizophagus sp. MUCL 43196]
MDYELTQNLCNDISNLRKDTSNCDVKIRVGKEPNIKEFKAHSLILSSRSIYFKKAFSAQWARKEDGFFISNQPNISPTVFEILINHIYSGTFSIENNESLVDVLIASDELELLEIYQQLEKHLLENESDWKFPKDFITLCQFRHDDHFSNLYQVAIDLVCRKPHLIFKSKEFLKMEEDHLIEILKRDDLKLEEIEIWDYLIKWGIKNTDSINNLSKWTSKDFTELEKTLHNCIPYIRFSQMPPNVFNIVSTQFKGILPKDLVDDVLQYFSDPNSKPLLKNLPLRVTVYPFDSKIINAKDAALISSWIDKKKGTSYHLRDIPFRFVLIYRASLEEFKFFHNRCDNKGPTVVIIKVRNSGEIIGGYNPLDWRSIKLNGEDMPSNNSEFYNNHKCKTSDSFIFSLFSSTNGVIPTLSRVSSKKEAIIWCKDKGPCFGLQDLWIQSSSRSGKSKQKSYEKTIINRETFEIEEYEVYQIIDTRFSYYEFIKRIYNESKILLLYLLGALFENRYVW